MKPVERVRTMTRMSRAYNRLYVGVNRAFDEMLDAAREVDAANREQKRKARIAQRAKQ